MAGRTSRNQTQEGGKEQKREGAKCPMCGVANGHPKKVSCRTCVDLRYLGPGVHTFTQATHLPGALFCHHWTNALHFVLDGSSGS